MATPRIYCSAARAIRELDRCSLRSPETGRDKEDWQEARRHLHQIMERNGYELSPTGRVRKRDQGHR